MDIVRDETGSITQSIEHTEDWKEGQRRESNAGPRRADDHGLSHRRRHPRADKLEALLRALDYRDTAGAWRHPDRQAIFVGDFIDRGPAQVRSGIDRRSRYGTSRPAQDADSPTQAVLI
jgi:hypothetical protein